MRKISNKEFKEKVYNLTNGEYEFLDNYINSETKIRCIHKKCYYIWTVRPNNFLIKNSRCPRCYHLKSSDKNKLEIHKILNDFYNNEYEIIKDYINNKHKMILLHKKCGYEFTITPYHLKLKYSDIICPYCNKKNTIGRQYFIKENINNIIKKRTLGEFVILKTYYFNTIDDNELLVKHMECSTIFKSKYLSVLKLRCPNCTPHESKCEKYFKKLLKLHNIRYIQNFRFTDNKFLRNKPFDFYLIDYNYIIEIDGEQHRHCKFSMSAEDLLNRQCIDRRKEKLIKYYGFSFKRFLYSEMGPRIKNDLNKFIEELSSTTIL